MTVFEAALRVLAAQRDGVAPDPEHVRVLLSAADRPQNVDDLEAFAVEIVDREVARLKRKRFDGVA